MTMMKHFEQLIKNRELPLIGSVLFVYMAVLFFQTDEQIELIKVGLFSLLMVCHGFNFYFRQKIYGKYHLLYFLSQSILIFLLAYVIGSGYKAAYLGLLPLIICQAIQLVETTSQVVIAILGFHSQYVLTVALFDGTEDLLMSIALFLLISTSVFTYYFIYDRLHESNETIRQLLLKLEATYQSLERAVSEKERQRLARDLHDTLAQSVAGMVMKLETLQYFVNEGDMVKCQAIASELTNQGKESLLDARNLIADLRTQVEEEPLLPMIEYELRTCFETVPHIIVKLQPLYLGMCPRQFNHQLRFMLREMLNNIKQHAQATQVIVTIDEDDDHIILSVKDNGIGFDYNKILMKKGHYGIKGLYERSRLINGYVIIDSKPPIGTTLTLIVPKGDEHSTYK